MVELFAVEGSDVALAGGGGATLLILTWLGTLVRSLRKDNTELRIAANSAAQTVDVSKGEERRKDDAVRQAHETTLYEQATERIDKLEKRDEEKTEQLRECFADRARLSNEVEWLRKFVGAPAMPDAPSGIHRPVPGSEGADV